MTNLFDVIATNIRTGARRVMDRGMAREDAEAYVKMAVMRRAVAEEFFSAVPSPNEKG
jgi:hypothetical protein